MDKHNRCSHEECCYDNERIHSVATWYECNVQILGTAYPSLQHFIVHAMHIDTLSAKQVKIMNAMVLKLMTDRMDCNVWQQVEGDLLLMGQYMKIQFQ